MSFFSIHIYNILHLFLLYVVCLIIDYDWAHIKANTVLK